MFDLELDKFIKVEDEIQEENCGGDWVFT